MGVPTENEKALSATAQSQFFDVKFAEDDRTISSDSGSSVAPPPYQFPQQPYAQQNQVPKQPQPVSQGYIAPGQAQYGQSQYSQGLRGGYDSQGRKVVGFGENVVYVRDEKKERESAVCGFCAGCAGACACCYCVVM